MVKTRKNRQIKRRKTFRGKRASVMGRIMPMLDVRTPKQLKEFEKRVKSGPLTIIMVYADWCGHCHTMMPHFKEASKSPDREIQSVMLNEEMLDSANKIINKNINHSAKPINVSGYPSLILVDNKSNKVTDIEPVRDTEVMTQVMNKSASLASNSGVISNSNVGEEELIGTLNMNMGTNVENSVNKNKNKPIISTLKNAVAPSTINSISLNRNIKSNIRNIPESIEKEAEFSSSLMNGPIVSSVKMNKNGNIEQTNLNTVAPPVVEDDIKMAQMKGGELKKGGDLMSALSRTSYTLAPAAILLASASYVMKRNKSKGKQTKVSKKTSKGKKSRKIRK